MGTYPVFCYLQTLRHLKRTFISCLTLKVVEKNVIKIIACLLIVLKVEEVLFIIGV
jgi:hypothetical protein